MEEEIIRIREWPRDQKALLDHTFPEPVEVTMTNDEKDPFFVNMNMNMAGQNNQPIPVCIKLCEPICAESNYRVGIHLFGQPFAEIVVRGITKVFSCDKKDMEQPGDMPEVVIR